MKTKRCFMPNCENNSSNCGKVFVQVPREFERRKTWWTLVGHSVDDLYLKADLYCCEDHFDKKEDFHNWEAALQPGKRLHMKKTTVPKFKPQIHDGIVLTAGNPVLNFGLLSQFNHTVLLSSNATPISSETPIPNDHPTMSKKGQKVCFVPTCGNNSDNCDKVFIFVPSDFEKRKIWWRTVGHTKPLSLKARLHCCEDHFNIRNDFNNWEEAKQRGRRLSMKHGVLPRVLQDKGSKRVCEDVDGNVSKAVKTEQLDSITKEEIIEDGVVTEETAMNQPALSPPKQVCAGAGGNISAAEETGQPCPGIKEEIIEDGVVTEETAMNQPALSPPKQVCAGAGGNISAAEETGQPCPRIKEELIEEEDIKVEEVTEETVMSPPLFSPAELTSKAAVNLVTLNSSSEVKKSVSLPPGSIITIKESETKRRKTTISAIEKYSSFYLGLSKQSYWLVKIICDKVKISHRDALIVLKKIRLNDPLIRLHVDFELSTAEIQSIIQLNFPKVANFMKDFIEWPKKDNIRRALPIIFRARYGKLQSIIDCFEVEIEQPSDSVKRASVWSDHKQAHTVKFLVSCTPNGYINFISLAYPGRITKYSIVRASGFCHKLPEGAQVLADQSFKKIEELLLEKNCILIDPTSMSQNEESSAQDVQERGEAAFLRTPLQRAIKKVQEFNMLAPEARIQHDLVPLLADAAVIACAIINFEEPLL